MNLSPEVFVILAALVERKVGIRYEVADREMFADKVASRVREAGFGSFLDYYYYLRYDERSGPELDALVEALVVHETYFFREADGLRVIVDELVRPIAASGRRARVWSCACASGDEPLTRAMMLADAGLLDATDIVASDVTLRAFERARREGWGKRSLRSLPPAGARWVRVRGEKAHVASELVDAVDWRRVNVIDDLAVRALGTFDVVLCRNVLIYFSDATIVDVVTRLADRLRPDGRLLVGASESLLRFGTLLECEERSGTFMYRRATT